MAKVVFMFGPLDRKDRELELSRIGYPVTHVTECLHEQDFVRWIHTYEYHYFYDGIYYYQYQKSVIDCKMKLAKLDTESAEEIWQQIMTQAGILHMILREGSQNDRNQEDTHSTSITPRLRQSS